MNETCQIKSKLLITLDTFLGVWPNLKLQNWWMKLAPFYILYNTLSLEYQWIFSIRDKKTKRNNFKDIIMKDWTYSPDSTFEETREVILVDYIPVFCKWKLEVQELEGIKSWLSWEDSPVINNFHFYLTCVYVSCCLKKKKKSFWILELQDYSDVFCTKKIIKTLFLSNKWMQNGKES